MIDPVAFRIFSLSIRWYALLIAFALIISLFLMLKRARQVGIKEEFILDFFIWGIPSGIIGGRLYYVIFKLDYYLKYPIKIFAMREGGMAIHGVVIGGILALLLLCKKREISFLKMADLTAPALILGQAIGRWGNFINQEAYGGIVSKSYISNFPEFIQKQMYIRGNYHHPAFLYESLWNLFVFLFLIFIRNKGFLKKGDILFMYLIGYSVGRFFIEGLRTDSLMLGSMRVAQLISIILIVFSSIVIYLRHRTQ